jgi:hypothetical protein
MESTENNWTFWKDFGPISNPCILGTVTTIQNHLHITFKDINEEYKEESIHQNCMKNKHQHTKTKQTLFLYGCYCSQDTRV